MTSSYNLRIRLVVSVARASDLRFVLLILSLSDPHAWVHVKKLVLELFDHVVLLVHLVLLVAIACFAYDVIKVFFLWAALAIHRFDS